MDNKFSIYESPFSDETKVLRRNSLIASGLCLFIGLTGELPEKFALLGVSFSTKQQGVIGWFILAVTIYLFLHFLSIAGVEFAKWVHPFYTQRLKKKLLIKQYSHAFSEEDFIDIPSEVNEQDKNDMAAHAAEDANWQAEKKLRWLYALIYLRLVVEILAPLILGLWGVYEMVLLLISVVN